MIRVSFLYPAAAGAGFDHEYYHATHYRLCRERLDPEGLVSIQFDRGVADGAGGGPPFLAIAHLVFRSVEEFQAAMRKHGPELLGDVPNYTTIKPLVQINEMAVG